MTTLVDSPTFGNERIAREALIVLMDVLNEELLAQNNSWATLDEQLATLRGVPYDPLELEIVEPANFHLGHTPSLIEAPVEGYPNVSVMADRTGPSGVDDFDQISNYDVKLWIEFMVKSINNEQEVNSRVQRMADAINTCVMSNRTLRGVVQEIGATPTLSISNVFIRKERTSHGDQWFWQGGRLDYTVQKEAVMPHGSSSRPAALAADIDQS